MSREVRFDLPRLTAETIGDNMTALPSNMDAILVAIPMVGLLFVGMFRLDEIIAKPQKRPERRRAMAGSDKNGSPLCIDPDGTMKGKRGPSNKAPGRTGSRASATDESGTI